VAGEHIVQRKIRGGGNDNSNTEGTILPEKEVRHGMSGSRVAAGRAGDSVGLTGLSVGAHSQRLIL
jgi:hypothetical protein